MATAEGDSIRLSAQERKRSALLADLEKRLDDSEEMIKKLKRNAEAMLKQGAELARRMVEDPKEEKWPDVSGETPDADPAGKESDVSADTIGSLNPENSEAIRQRERPSLSGEVVTTTLPGYDEKPCLTGELVTTVLPGIAERPGLTGEVITTELPGM